MERWHHVGTDDRPEFGVYVLLFTRYGKMQVGRWLGEAAGWTSSHVTHWRHLPAGPHEVCDVDVP